MQIAAPCGNGASDGQSNNPRNRVCDFDCDVSGWPGFMEWSMSEFVEAKTAELTGAALDWAVAKVCGVRYINSYIVTTERNAIGEIISSSAISNYRPSTDWAHGGTLLDRYDIALNGGVAGGERVIYATLRAVDDNEPFATATGSTRLIATCRAVVSAKLGDVVRVPEGLEVVK